MPSYPSHNGHILNWDYVQRKLFSALHLAIAMPNFLQGKLQTKQYEAWKGPLAIVPCA